MSAPTGFEAAFPGDGATQPCVAEARDAVEAAGFGVAVFRASGLGGRSLELAASGGLFAGILDVTTTELADELCGGYCSSGPDRLTAAALRGVPQVIVPGAVDRFRVRSSVALPQDHGDPVCLRLSAEFTLVRTTLRQNDRLGREIALKASAARGPTALFLPLRGVSALDHEGRPFWWPEADAALFQSIRNWVSPHVRLVELDMHVNDPAFALAAAGTLLEMV
jgi:uncharacterized protein (UPF0261 family)